MRLSQLIVNQSKTVMHNLASFSRPLGRAWHSQPCATRALHNLVGLHRPSLGLRLSSFSHPRISASCNQHIPCSSFHSAEPSQPAGPHRSHSPEHSAYTAHEAAPKFLAHPPHPEPMAPQAPQGLTLQHPCVVPPSPLKRRRADHDVFGGGGHGGPDQGIIQGADLSKALKSVCKVFATIANPNYATPWQVHQQTKSTASGFVIAPLSARRILTNAHAVANQIQVQLRKHGNARKFVAKVLAVGHECDIAMLTVEDDEFWRGVEALEIGGLPAMQESVSVVGYPTGGDNVCVTKGVVSRVDRQQYSHGRTSLLALQIDAAINSGNSGGPVLKGDKVIGIAFQCLTQGENIGYVIPVPVIHHFLTDLTRHGGKYTGFCDLGMCWQTLESNDHKASLGMPQHMSGVYVTAVEPCYHAAQVLRPGDVITHFNGHSIADDGTFLFEPHMHLLPSPPLSPLPSPRPTNTPLLQNHPAVGPAAITHHMAALSVMDHSPETAARGLATSRGSPEPAGHMHLSVSGTSMSRDARDSPEVSGLGLATPMAAVTMPAVGSTGGFTHHAPHHPLQNTSGALVPAQELHVSHPQHPAQLQPHVDTRSAAGQPPHMAMTHPHQAVRIDFRHLVSMNYEGDSCQLDVWREGSVHSVQVQLSTPKQLVPVHSHDVKPHFFIFGGLVFTRLTNFYLRSTYGTDWTHKAPIKLCDRSFAGYKEAEGQEVVILSKVLAWECNAGYQDLGNVEVLKAGGVPVHNLPHLAHILTHAPGKYIRLDLQWNKVVMLDIERCRAAAGDILMQNSIPGAGYHPPGLLKSPVQLPTALHEATQALLGPGPDALGAADQPAALTQGDTTCTPGMSKVPSLHFATDLATDTPHDALHTTTITTTTTTSGTTTGNTSAANNVVELSPTASKASKVCSSPTSSHGSTTSLPTSSSGASSGYDAPASVGATATSPGAATMSLSPGGGTAAGAGAGGDLVLQPTLAVSLDDVLGETTTSSSGSSETAAAVVLGSLPGSSSGSDGGGVGAEQEGSEGEEEEQQVASATSA